MLVLSRKQNEEICVGDDIRIRILKIKGNTIRIGIEAPRDIRVIRGELEFEVGDLDCHNDLKASMEQPVEDSEGPHQDGHSDVTIVFKNLAKSSTRVESADVIPFVSNRTNLKKSDRLDADQQVENSETYRSIQFREPLPINLRNNRLKDLVHEITQTRK